jgi:hypothetical protein
MYRWLPARGGPHAARSTLSRKVREGITPTSISVRGRAIGSGTPSPPRSTVCSSRTTTNVKPLIKQKSGKVGATTESNPNGRRATASTRNRWNRSTDPIRLSFDSTRTQLTLPSAGVVSTCTGQTPGSTNRTGCAVRSPEYAHREFRAVARLHSWLIMCVAFAWSPPSPRVAVARQPGPSRTRPRLREYPAATRISCSTLDLVFGNCYPEGHGVKVAG